MMIKIFTLFWIIYCEFTKSTKATFDIGSREMLREDTEKYCAHPNCPKWSHVLCMNPEKHSRKCMKLKKVRLTEEYIDSILNIINKFRSDAARGKVLGYDGRPLPKAYGMIKVKWDNTLAFYAQVWANNCPTTHDNCRATDRFSDPGQMVFTVPLESKIEDSDISPLKIRLVIKNAMDYALHDKTHVNADDIKNTPNWIKVLTEKNNIEDIYFGGQYYTNIVHSNVTHIGCGLSVAASSRSASDLLPSFEPVYKAYFVCNLSHQPKLGFPVYDSIPPKITQKNHTDKGIKKKQTTIYKQICTSKAHCVALDFSDDKNGSPSTIPEEEHEEQCGCPDGWNQTKDCLCEQLDDQHEEITTEEPDKQDKDEEELECCPELVLPIVADDKTRRLDLQNYFIPDKDTEDYINTKQYYLSRNKPGPVITVNPDLYEDIPKTSHDWKSETKKERKHIGNNNKQSLFAKVPKFQIYSFSSKPNKKDDVQRDYETEINQNNENDHGYEPVHNFDSKPHKKDDIQRVYETQINLNNENVNDDRHNNKQSYFEEPDKKYDDQRDFETEMKLNTNNDYAHEPLPGYGSKPDKKYDIQKDYDAEINNNDENIEETIEDKTENLEEKTYMKEEVPDKNEGSLIDLLDNIETAIQNTPLDRGKKEIIHSKIKKIYSMVGLPEDSNLQYSDTNQKVINRDNVNRNAESTDMLSESEDVISEDQVSDIHHYEPSRYDKNTLRSTDQRRTKPFDLQTFLSKGKLTMKNRVPNEDIMPNSKKNYEFYSHETLKPKMQHKIKHNERRKDLESLMEIGDKKYRKRITKLSNKPISEYIYDNDKTDKEYRNKHSRYEEDINSDNSFEDNSKGFITNNERLPHSYKKYDTDAGYGEDSSDREWLNFYKEKLDKYNVKQRKPYRTARFHDDLRRRSSPVHNMQRRLKDLGLSLSRPRPDHYHESDHARYKQEYYY